MRINWKQLLVKLSSIHTDITKSQEKRKPFKNEKGKDTPLQAEFTGDKLPKSGDSAKKEVAAWREQNALGKKLNLKANPLGGISPIKETNWRNLGSALTNSVAGRSETVDKHEELAMGSAPAYKTGTKFRVGAKFASRKSNRVAIMQDMGTFSKFKDKIAAGTHKFINTTGEVAPANENLIVVAYTRPEVKGETVLLTPLGNFVASFEHKADDEMCDTSEKPEKVKIPEVEENPNNSDKGLHGESAMYDGTSSRVFDKATGYHGTIVSKSGPAGAVVKWDETGQSTVAPMSSLEVMSSWKSVLKAVAEGKPYYCSTCDAGFSEGQMNFHKGHDYEKKGEGEEKDDGEAVEEEEKGEKETKEAANIEFQKKPDGTVNISMEDTPEGMGDMVNGMPTGVPQPVAPAQPVGAQDVAAPAPEVAPAKGKKATYEVGSLIKDADLGDGTIESINGEEVIASFSGKKYKTTLDKLG